MSEEEKKKVEKDIEAIKEFGRERQQMQHNKDNKHKVSFVQDDFEAHIMRATFNNVDFKYFNEI